MVAWLTPTILTLDWPLLRGSRNSVSSPGLSAMAQATALMVPKGLRPML